MLTTGQYQTTQVDGTACDVVQPSPVPLPTSQCVKFPHFPLVVDNGVDPILGAPWPPVNYMLTGHDTQPRLTWTVPGLFIILDPADPLGGLPPDGGSADLVVTFQFYVTNYGFPPWNGSTHYIKNSPASFGGNRYWSLIDGNFGHQPDTSPTFWELDDTFWVLKLKTVNQVSGLVVDFQTVLDSTGNTYGYSPADFIFAGASFGYFGTDYIPYMPFAVQRQTPAERHDLYFYVVAQSGVDYVSSFLSHTVIDL